MTKPNPIELVESLELAKAKEIEARRIRVALEEQLVAVLGARDEGSETHTVGDYRVTVTAKMTRAVDWQAWGSVAERIPEELRPVRVKQELDLKKLHRLERDFPSDYAIVAECLTVKPAKTAVTIKRSK